MRLEDNKLRLEESKIKRQEDKTRFAEACFDIVKMCSDICEVLKGDFVDSFIKKSLWDIIEKDIINSCFYDKDSNGHDVPGMVLVYKNNVSKRIRLSSVQEEAYYRVKNFI